MDKWTELRTAYQVGKLGTVSAAAEVLGQSRATVNRHIETLEETMGARIFIRHARGYTLTELGEHLMRVGRTTEELTNDLAGRAQGTKTDIEGQITLTSVAPMAGLLLPAVAAFRERYPQCGVVFDASSELARLEYGEAHVAIRAGKKPEALDYVVQPYRTVQLGLYAHESYIARRGLAQDVSDLAHHDFVGRMTVSESVPFASWLKENVPANSVVLDTSLASIALDAVSAGLGISVVADYDVAARPGLRRVLPDHEGWQVPLWVVTHVDLHRTAKVQAMLACLRDTVSQWA